MNALGSNPRPSFRSVVTLAAAAIAAVALRRPLVAWFTGQPTGGATRTATAQGGPLVEGGGASDRGRSPRDTGAADAGAIDHYTCSMHPSVRESAPGTCPICGMKLVPVTQEQQAQGVVVIDDVRRQLIGVRTQPVVAAPMRDTFRAVGHVTYDESAIVEVNLKVRGWITKLYVTETGQSVRTGQPLFAMYSPELYDAEQDFLLGARAAAVAGPAPDADPGRADPLARAARRRLRLLGLSDAQIDAIAKAGTPFEQLAIFSPASGFVIEKNVVEGASVDAGERLYRIASLRTVWVDADVYESDLARVRVGQRAAITLDYLPGRLYEAEVASVYPYLDPASRTGRVRLKLANAHLDLRPGMYASVTMTADLGVRVQVPAAAVVYTGPRRLVFTDLGGGRFRPTEVRVGTESNGMYEVLSGLSPGERVATSGVFLIAAEARISTAAAYWDRAVDTGDAGDAASETAAPGAAAATPAVPSTPTDELRGPGAATTPARPLPPTALSPALGPSTAPRSAPGETPASAPAAPVYECPMHPEVQRSTPGKCPKCGMDLVPHSRQP